MQIKFKNLLYTFLILFCLSGQSAFADKITGQVEKAGVLSQNQVVDVQTGFGVPHAKITVPANGYQTTTDAKGVFQLNTTINKPVILSVEKENYRPFSITVGKEMLESPLRLGIEQAHANDIIIEKELCHLGDNVFSQTSANSSDFKSKSLGPFYSKKFNIGAVGSGEEACLIIGSVIGLDTKMAKELGQNNVRSVYSSPAEVYLNGQKIGELNVNGDNQEVPIPKPLLRPTNEITIKTGHNLFQRSYIDYDDIEIMNLSIEIKAKQISAFKD